MRRRFINDNDAYREVTKDCIRVLERHVEQKSDDMGREWQAIDSEWKKLENSMIQIGIKPGAVVEGRVRMNVGGSYCCLPRSVLSGSSALAKSNISALLEVAWDERLPRDDDGRLVLDESPACFQHLIETPSDTASLGGNVLPKPSPFLLEAIEPHDTTYLQYLKHFLWLQETPRRWSTIIWPSERVTMLRQLCSWCPDSPPGMTLLYQASQDGFTGAIFHARCDKAMSTLSLIKVRHENDHAESVIGGYSGTSWAREGSKRSFYKPCHGAFIFLLRDGNGCSQAVRWSVRESTDNTADNTGVQRGAHHHENAIFRDTQCGPSFGNGSLVTDLKGSSETSRVFTNANTYAIGTCPASLAFLRLNGAQIHDMEVFMLSTNTAPDLKSSSVHGSSASTGDSGSNDVRSFGLSIARSFAFEKQALKEARAELNATVAKVTAAHHAVKTIYGPYVARGDEDVVVKLNVQGTTMTTLKSTLQVRPDSALATRFDESRWPSNGTDIDEDGRRQMDCDPLCFRKILDVLRIRKRSSWSQTPVTAHNDDSKESSKDESFMWRVTVPNTYKEKFEILVNMLFPGSEGFITDLVAFSC